MERKRGKGGQGTCIKDPWTKTAGGKIESRRWKMGRAGERNRGNMETTIMEQP